MAYILLERRVSPERNIMDREARKKALGYAAKTVLSAAFLAACGSEAASTDDGNVAPASDDEIIAGNVACKEGLKKLKEVFPNGDKQWFSHFKGPDPKLKGDKEVTACCESMLKGSETDFKKVGAFRNDGCCASEAQNIGAACSPWGPPVPPSMKWVA